MISKSHIDLNVWSKGGKLLDWFEILRIDRLAYEPMAFTRERLHDSSKIFVEQARCLLLGYSFYPRPNSNALGTAVVVITSGLTITDASTRKTSLIRENKIDWFRSLGCGGFKNLTRSRKPTFHLLDQEEDKRKLCSQGASSTSFCSTNWADEKA